MTNIIPPLPPEIQSLEPYQPGKPIEELERELGISGACKLASNENPLGPSPKAVAAMQRVLTKVHRYPDGAGFELRTALAQKFGVNFNQTCLGNGSDEIIEFLCRAFIRPGQKALAASPSFLMYSKLVQVAGGTLVEVGLDKDFKIDTDALLKAVTCDTRIIFLNNPDNPAGTSLTKDEMTRFLDRLPDGVLTVLDEAYIDFVSAPDCCDGRDFLNHPKPVVLMRTFSKSAGLAGLRIGYAIGPKEVIDAFDRVRQPFNTSIPAQEAALAALSDHEFLEKTRKLVLDGLKSFYQCFDSLGLFYVPSQTNFVLVEIGEKAKEVAEALLKRGIIIRHMGSYDMPRFIRVTVGLPEENKRFTKELESILAGDRLK